MSVRLMAAVFELAIPASEKLVLLAMADHARDDGTGCYPSIDLLARKTSQTRRGVQKIMRRLEEQRGLIAPSRVSRGHRSTEYRITLENREPGSLFTVGNSERQTRKPRTWFHSTANGSAQNREPGSPEPSGTIKEPSEEPENRQQNPLPVPLISAGSETPKPITESQSAYRNVGKLISPAIAILARSKSFSTQLANADCREELKQWAATNDVPYDSEAISKAFTVAEGRLGSDHCAAAQNTRQSAAR